jgi:hypothetical protein
MTDLWIYIHIDECSIATVAPHNDSFMNSTVTKKWKGSACRFLLYKIGIFGRFILTKAKIERNGERDR